MVRRIGFVFSLALLIATLTACAPSPQQSEEPSAPEPAPQAPQSANVTVQPTQGNTAAGSLTIMGMDDGVHFMGSITGLTPGLHGFHIHETGDCSAPDGSSAGGHFNPEARNHGALHDAERHLGDLGNIEADAGGTAQVNIHVTGVSLGPGTNSVMGRSVIVHADADDLKSQPSGNAGARLGCGVIQPGN